MYEQRRSHGPASQDPAVPVICAATGVVLAFWGRLDETIALAQALDLPPDQRPALTDAELILAGWHHWGDRLPEHLQGEFSMAIADPRRGGLFLARDPLGVKPLYYRPAPEALSFATSLPGLRALQQEPLTPDADWLARYLLYLSMSTRQTAYTGVVKLPPGHSLWVDAQGRETLRRWHAWRDAAPPARHRDERWVAAYREGLEEAVRCRMPVDGPIGVENSGGLDSATLTAYLAHLLGEPGERLHAFGFALARDEPSFMLETSQARRIRHNHLITHRPGLDLDDDVLQQALTVLGYPEEHHVGTAHHAFYAECRWRGIGTLFSGFGGDECVTQFGQHLPWELLDAGHYGALWGILPGHPLRRGHRWVKALAGRRRKPAVNPRHLAAYQARWPHQLVRPDLAERLELEQAYLDKARYDGPYRRINDFILRELLPAPYLVTRLETCTLLAAAQGVDYQWPLLDSRLIQQYLDTPSIEKRGPGGMGRYLHRRAVSGIVPPRVAWKSSKDMGYAGVFGGRLEARLAAHVTEARRHAGQLHPAIEDLIDRRKFLDQIREAGAGRRDEPFARSFLASVTAIRWLNFWLQGDTVS